MINCDSSWSLFLFYMLSNDDIIDYNTTGNSKINAFNENDVQCMWAALNIISIFMHWNAFSKIA